MCFTKKKSKFPLIQVRQLCAFVGKTANQPNKTITRQLLFILFSLFCKNLTEVFLESSTKLPLFMQTYKSG